MGFQVSAATQNQEKALREYGERLLTVGRLAIQAAFHVKQGNDREAKTIIKKMVKKAKELDRGADEATD